MAEPEKPIDAAPKAERKPKGGAQGAKGAPAKGRSSKKGHPFQKAPKGAKAAKPAKDGAGAPRESSKTAQVVAMLQRKNGATLTSRSCRLLAELRDLALFGGGLRLRLAT